MGMDIQADDWQVLGTTSFGLGFWLAVGKFTFDFYSQNASANVRFIFAGIGGGLGGKGANWALDGITEWSALNCQRAFSANQLNRAPGTLWTASAGVGAQVGPCYVEALTPGGHYYFKDSDVGGISGGLSAGVMALSGRWIMVGAVHNKPAGSEAWA